MDLERQKIFRKRLNEEMISIQESIKNLKGQIKPVAPDNAIGRLSRMDAINQKSVAETSLQLAKNKLVKLENALSRVGDDEFGICLDCEVEIPLERLLLIPESQMCVKCLQAE